MTTHNTTKLTHQNLKKSFLTWKISSCPKTLLHKERRKERKKKNETLTNELNKMKNNVETPIPQDERSLHNLYMHKSVGIWRPNA